MAVLYGNDAYSILVLSTKKRTPLLEKKISFFRKFVSNLKYWKRQSFNWLEHKNMPILQTEGYFENL